MSATYPGGASEQLFRQLVESVRDYAIFVLDAGGHVASWNAGAELIKGYSAREILGAHISTFYPADDVAAGRPQLLLETAATAGRVEDTGWRVRKDGSRFWADVVITSRRDEAGHLLGFTKVTRDLTARRLAEEQLRRSEEQARLIVEGVTDYAIFMLDPNGRVTSWNSGAKRIKGYDADEIIGTSFERFYPQEDLDDRKPQHELEVAGREGRFEDEGWRLRKDGSRFWANVVISALRDPSGQLIGFAKVTRDLTARVTLEEERVRAARAEEGLRLRDEFLAVVAHELRTPLTALLLGLNGVQAQLARESHPLSVRLTRAVQSGDRLAKLVETLLDVARIASHRLTLARAPADMGEIVAQVCEHLRPMADRARCELRVVAPAGITGEWDRVRFEQVVSNLVDNAIKFGAGHPVDVALRLVEPDACELQIGDRGPGIEDADLRRIFERFERAASVRRHGGLGLGLYVAQRIVIAHGGRLTAQRRDGGGTYFTARLPRTQGSTDDAQGEA